MAFLGLLAIIGSQIGIFIVSHWTGRHYATLIGAISMGLVLAPLAGVFGGMSAGAPGAMFHAFPVSIVIFAFGILAARSSRTDAAKVTTGDSRAFVDYLNVQFSNPSVASVPWVAQDWKHMSDSAKIELVEQTQNTMADDLFDAHDNATKLYQTLYTSSLKRLAVQE